MLFARGKPGINPLVSFQSVCIGRISSRRHALGRGTDQHRYSFSTSSLLGNVCGCPCNPSSQLPEFGLWTMTSFVIAFAAFLALPVAFPTPILGPSPDFPGGPLAYYISLSDDALSILGDSAVFLQALLSDAFMVFM